MCVWIGGCFSPSLSPLLLVGANSISVSHQKTVSRLKLLPCLAGKLKASNEVTNYIFGNTNYM